MMLLYVKALGTPYPVGTRIIDSVTGKRHTVSGFRYTERDGLVIDTEDGAVLPGYELISALLDGSQTILDIRDLMLRLARVNRWESVEELQAEAMDTICQWWEEYADIITFLLGMNSDAGRREADVLEEIIA